MRKSPRFNLWFEARINCLRACPLYLSDSISSRNVWCAFRRSFCSKNHRTSGTQLEVSTMLMLLLASSVLSIARTPGTFALTSVRRMLSSARFFLMFRTSLFFTVFVTLAMFFSSTMTFMLSSAWIILMTSPLS